MAAESILLLEEVLQCIDDYRYVGAYQKFERLQAQMQSSDFPTATREEIDAVIRTNQNQIDLMVTRYLEIHEALREDESESEWVFGLELFGIRTHYQYDQKTNEIKIKLDGLLEDLPLFEQCAVIHEVDLFHEWVPFCRESITVDKIGKAELIPYINIGIPGMSRDFALNAYGADCLIENGKILILGKSIEEYEAKPLPFKAAGWFHNRMKVKVFSAIVEVLTPTSAKTTIIAQVDPHAPLPQSLLNFLIKNLAGALLYFFQKQVVKVTHDHNCAHAKRIRENHGFYRDWVLPKLRKFCDVKGWPQPTVLSLGEDGIPATPHSYLKEEQAVAPEVVEVQDTDSHDDSSAPSIA